VGRASRASYSGCLPRLQRVAVGRAPRAGTYPGNRGQWRASSGGRAPRVSGCIGGRGWRGPLPTAGCCAPHTSGYPGGGGMRWASPGGSALKVCIWCAAACGKAESNGGAHEEAGSGCGASSLGLPQIHDGLARKRLRAGGDGLDPQQMGLRSSHGSLDPA
jgi:hypothetical protein